MNYSNPTGWLQEPLSPNFKKKFFGLAEGLHRKIGVLVLGALLGRLPLP